MIFNTFAYYFLFLVPAAVLYRVAPAWIRPWIIVLFGSGFFLYFAYDMAGFWGAACLLIFLWESVVSRLYQPSSRWCVLGLVQSVILLGIFKYWNFFTGLVFLHAPNPLRWQGQFLPLGISFSPSSSTTTRGIGGRGRRRRARWASIWPSFCFSRRWWPGRSSATRIFCRSCVRSRRRGVKTGSAVFRGSWRAW